MEDNTVNELVAQGMVTQLGYRVDTAANGVDALLAIDTTAHTAVFKVCHMP